MDISLKNKCVVILGASTGIGCTLSKAFYQEGAYVVATFNKHEIKSPDNVDNTRWDIQHCDITDSHSIHLLKEHVKQN